MPGTALHSRTPPRSSKGPTLERVDDRFEYGEVRVYAIGVVSGIEITVLYTDVSRTERRIYIGLEGGTA